LSSAKDIEPIGGLPLLPGASQYASGTNAMGKNIILCSDPTARVRIDHRRTNLERLLDAIDSNGHRTDPLLAPQVVFSDGGGASTGWDLLDAVTGVGLERRVRRLYADLARVYDPGDRLFFFGAGRGASTVRTLVDLIVRCGILDVQKVPTAGRFARLVDEACVAYRRGRRTRLQERLGWAADREASRRFRAAHARPGEVSIAFVGVWDTVDAGRLVGRTLQRLDAPDRHLSPSVERAAQALALDDDREALRPRLWHLRHGDEQRVQQVWFSGEHASVSGESSATGLSMAALDWMLQQAEAAGLRLVPSGRARWAERIDVDGAFASARASLFWRRAPRDLERLCREHEVPPAVHLSVLERIAHGPGGYAPGNLPPASRVVITPTGDADCDALARERARSVEEVLRQAHAARQSLLRRVEMELLVHRVSYRVALASLALALLAGLAWGSGPLLALGLVGLLVARGLAGWAERRMRDAFSGFWFGVQGELRRALKRARHVAARRRSFAAVTMRALPRD